MRFYKANYTESKEPLANPDCGWYRIYPFLFKEISGEIFPSLDLRQLYESLMESGEERLALIQFHIGFFREKELTYGVLQQMERILECFRASGKQIILRVAYDLEGKGLLQEPESETMVHMHMAQLGPLFCAYAPDILTLQGIFVGNWGEMHSSRFLSEPVMTRLVLSLYHTSGGKCFLALRTPAQWRSVMARLKGEPGLEEKLTLFNDGLFGSDTDLGTYGAHCGKNADEAGRLGRKEELEWQNRVMGGKPVGGEAVASFAPMGYRQASKEMTKIHTCYLNSAYHKKQLDFWRRETVDTPDCWGGISGYDYIGRHLGPRFFIRDVKKVGRKLFVVLQNKGFSGVCRETDCFLAAEQEDGSKEELLLNADVRSWHGGQTVRMFIPLPAESKFRGTISLSLILRRRMDHRIIRFANKGASDSVRLGWIRKE